MFVLAHEGLPKTFSGPEGAVGLTAALGGDADWACWGFELIKGLVNACNPCGDTSEVWPNEESS